MVVICRSRGRFAGTIPGCQRHHAGRDIRHCSLPPPSLQLRMLRRRRPEAEAPAERPRPEVGPRELVQPRDIVTFTGRSQPTAARGWQGTTGV